MDKDTCTTKQADRACGATSAARVTVGTTERPIDTIKRLLEQAGFALWEVETSRRATGDWSRVIFGTRDGRVIHFETPGNLHDAVQKIVDQIAEERRLEAAIRALGSVAPPGANEGYAVREARRFLAMRDAVDALDVFPSRAAEQENQMNSLRAYLEARIDEVRAEASMAHAISAAAFKKAG